MTVVTMMTMKGSLFGFDRGSQSRLAYPNELLLADTDSLERLSNLLPGHFEVHVSEYQAFVIFGPR